MIENFRTNPGSLKISERTQESIRVYVCSSLAQIAAGGWHSGCSNPFCIPAFRGNRGWRIVFSDRS
jgi:hypothetical protein